MVKCLMLIFIMFWVTMNKNCAISEPLAHADVECPVYARVTATAYTACVAECDDTPNITAFNKPIRKDCVGVSRDMEQYFMAGDVVYIIDKGGNIIEKTIGDRMNKRWFKRIDILFSNKKQAREFGKQNVVIYRKGVKEDDYLYDWKLGI